MLKSKLWQRWLMALLLALGLGTLWGLLIAISGSALFALWPSDRKSFQFIEVTTNGQPLVHTNIGGNYLNKEFRTLDGEKIDPDEVQMLSAAATTKPSLSPGLFTLPVTWHQRLAGMCDYARPPVEWVMIRDAELSGHAYLAGFDPITKLPVGYLGHAGFRQSKPPIGEQFDLGKFRLTNTDKLRFAGAHRVNFSGRAYPDSVSDFNEKQSLSVGTIYLADAHGSIHEINLRTRKVRTLVQLSGVTSIAITRMPRPRTSAGNGEDAGQENEPINGTLQLNLRATQFPPLNGSQFTLAQHTTLFVPDDMPEVKKRKLVHRLVARCVDRLVVINPFEGTRKIFPLPENLRNTGFSARIISEGELFLEVERGYWEQGKVLDLMLLNLTGEITSKKTVRLSSYVPDDPSYDFT